jgi:hypothetical protein
MVLDMLTGRQISFHADLGQVLKPVLRLHEFLDPG